MVRVQVTLMINSVSKQANLARGLLVHSSEMQRARTLSKAGGLGSRVVDSSMALTPARKCSEPLTGEVGRFHATGLRWQMVGAVIVSFEGVW